MRNTYQLDESDYAPAAPRRRASARAAAQARTAGNTDGTRADALRGLLRMNWRKFLIITSAALLIAIVANALFLQTARHPAPLFAGAGSPTPQHAALSQPAIPVPSPRPAELASASAAPATIRAAAPTRDIADLIEPRSKDPISKDPIAALLKSAVPSGQVPAAAAPMTEATKRIVSAQKALSKLGYGVTPDGVFGAETRQAVQRFERDRNLPQTGEVAGRTMRELAAQSGIQIN